MWHLSPGYWSGILLEHVLAWECKASNKHHQNKFPQNAKIMFRRSCLSMSHVSVCEFNQALLPLTHTARGISNSEVSTCSLHFFLFFFYSRFVFHLNPTCAVKSTFQNWGRKRPYCPCTPDLALGHGDCAVKVELYGFLRLWKPVCALHVSQKCQLPEIQDVTGVLDTENTGLWTLKAAASTVDIVPIWAARSTPQQLPLALLKRKKVCKLALSSVFLTAFLKQGPGTSAQQVHILCWCHKGLLEQAKITCEMTIFIAKAAKCAQFQTHFKSILQMISILSFSFQFSLPSRISLVSQCGDKTKNKKKNKKPQNKSWRVVAT